MPATMGLYAIIDLLSEDILQNIITLSRHPTPMVRMFTDLLTGKQGPIAQHPEDYILVRLGYLSEDRELDSQYEVVLTGKQWLANRQEPTADSPQRNIGLHTT